jgi:hypothetical protein
MIVRGEVTMGSAIVGGRTVRGAMCALSASELVA